VPAAVDASTKEVTQYRSALRIGEVLVHEHGFISVDHIVTIQTQIVGNDAGLRVPPGTALVNDRTEEVVYTPPQDPDVIRRLLSNFADFYNGGPTSLADMAILHYQFETIHPYLDGNGRSATRIAIFRGPFRSSDSIVSDTSLLICHGSGRPDPVSHGRLNHPHDGRAWGL
jgi:Fic family protein